MSTHTPSARPSTGSQVLAGVVFVVSVLAFVTLEVLERRTDGLMVLVGPAVAALIINAHVTATTKEQNRTLSKIDSQTNGALSSRDAKIDELTVQLLEARAELAAVTAPPATSRT